MDGNESCHSPLISIELEDVVNFHTFMELSKEDEQRHLVKYLSSVDHSGLPESLKCMFNSGQFKGALSNFQHLLSEGMSGTYGSKLSPQVFLKNDHPRLSRKELFRKTMNKLAHAWKLVVDLRLSEEEASSLRSSVGNVYTSYKGAGK